ncbi:MAG: hypothetical protein HYZ58_19165, partial [Acidobacteria bacterium]|nr:hypothetical protein [Acidobacteriota bacterium]
QLDGDARPRCRVVFTLERRHVAIDYPYAMSRREFEEALHRVADSAKRTRARSIGRLGIGIFSFQQIGRKCTFLSRKTEAAETLRVVLKEGSDEASVETALARDALDAPGMRVVISELKFDPSRPRGPLAPDTLRRYLGEKFEAYLREGWLEITIVAGVAEFLVLPPRVRLPRLMTALRTLHLADAAEKTVRLDLYFDPSGKGRVAIRHHGVTVVEDLSAINAYGIEESAYARGYVRGSIDADFLTPLPARTSFEENADWIALLDLLDRYQPTLQGQIDAQLGEHRAKQASDIERRALRIARDILDLDEFRDLALPGGLAKRGRPAPPAPDEPKGRRTRATALRQRPKDPGQKSSPRGQRIGYREVPFENGSRAHSRFASGVVEANTLHPDYVVAARAPESRLAYAALLIGKETIAFNDRTGAVGDFLEKLLDFSFTLQARRPWRGRRPRESNDEEQAPLDLT